MLLDVLCIGVATLDSIARVQEIPGDDERVVAEPFVSAGGGPAATAAVTLARLGKSVGFCGVVGDDEAGRLVKEHLAAEGVDTTWLIRKRGLSTPQSMILVARQTGSRTIITTPSSAPDPDDIPTDAARWLHVDQTGYASTRGAVQHRVSPASLSIDGGNPIAGLRLADVDLYAPTVQSLKSMFPGLGTADAMRAAASSGARQVVATAGSAGSLVLVGDEVRTVHPFDVEAVSTMGAGDVFHGAFLDGIVDGLPLLDAALRANAVAALSCRALDGRTAVPDRTETERYLSSQPAPSRPA